LGANLSIFEEKKEPFFFFLCKIKAIHILLALNDFKIAFLNSNSSKKSMIFIFSSKRCYNKKKVRVKICTFAFEISIEISTNKTSNEEYKAYKRRVRQIP
jgi:hypothetical protein